MISKLEDLKTIDITPQLDNQKIINSFSNTTITVSGQKYTSNIIISPEGIEEFKDLEIVYKDIASSRDTLYIIGVEINSTKEKIKDYFKKNSDLTNLIEIMSLSSACRTYNVLVSEGRNVRAILFLDN